MPWLLLLGSLICADPAADPAVDPAAREWSVRLAQDADQGRQWSWGWGSALGTSAASQLALAAWVDDHDFRVDRLVGGLSSLIGVLAVIVTRPSAMSEQRKLGPCPSKVARDAAFARIAAQERFAQAWYQHVLGAAFNLGAGLYLGLAHDHWLGGTVHAVAGTAVSQLMIRTRPTRFTGFSLTPTASGAGERSYGLTLSARF